MTRVVKNIYRQEHDLYTLKYDRTVFFIHFFNTFRALFTRSGQKERSQKLFYIALYFFFLEFNNIDPIAVFYEIFNRERPLVLLTNRKIGGTNYKVPAPITTFKSFSLVFQLFKKSVYLRTDQTKLQMKFFYELRWIFISDYSHLRKKRLETNRTAYLNQSYIKKK